MAGSNNTENREPNLTVNGSNPEEKGKPFRLVKYFSFTSLIFIFLGTVVLSYLNTHYARTMQLEKSEEYAKVLIENLNHQIYLQVVLPMYGLHPWMSVCTKVKLFPLHSHSC